ncbi:MAG: fimbria/pilus periplasmic chaperone [Geobacteraceae bacterium]
MNSKYPHPGRSIRVTCFILAILWLACYQPKTALAGEWRVSPIRLDLGSEVKSGAVSVINEGAGRFQVQMKLFLWEQDAEGKDKYTESNDLVFFPKIMIFDKPEERILRAGIKKSAEIREKTYRLFIEEIPEPRKADGTNVAVAIRFGVPIFVKPLKEEPKGEIAKLELVKGECRVTVKNSGNVNFIINNVNIKGKNLESAEVFARKLDGWYLLNNVSRVYTAVIPSEACTETAKLDVEIKTNLFILNGKLDVDKSMCQ